MRGTFSLREAVEVKINHGGQVEREELREQQTADDGEAERLPHFGASAEAKGNRQGADQRGHAGHHDRAEADQTGFENGLLRGDIFRALPVEGEVDHHDGVFLDDADQHDDANKGVEAQIDLEHVKRDQRAERRRRQAGEDGQRVDEALVEDAENDVNDEDGNHQQHAEALQRGFKGLCCALQAGVERGRQAYFVFNGLDRIDRAAERETG